MEFPASQRTSISSIVRVVASLNCVEAGQAFLAVIQVPHHSISALYHYGPPKHQAPVLRLASVDDTESPNAELLLIQWVIGSQNPL